MSSRRELVAEYREAYELLRRMKNDTSGRPTTAEEKKTMDDLHQRLDNIRGTLAFNDEVSAHKMVRETRNKAASETDPHYKQKYEARLLKHKDAEAEAHAKTLEAFGAQNYSRETGKGAAYTATGEGLLNIFPELAAAGFGVNIAHMRHLHPKLGTVSITDEEAAARKMRREDAILPGPGRSYDIKGTTQLIRASAAGDEPLVRKLIRYGAPLDSTDKTFRYTALEWATINNHEDVVRTLLSNPVGKASKPDVLKSIQHAVEDGYEGILRLLLSSISVEEHPRRSMGDLLKNSLENAVTKGFIGCVNLLLEYGADPKTPGLFVRACENGNPEIIQSLLDLGASVNDTHGGGSTLSAAVRSESHNEIPLIVKLLDLGANPNAVTGITSPLIEACRSGKEPIVRLLLDRGANVDLRINDRSTPLCEACQLGYIEIVDLLLQRGANPNKTVVEGGWPHMTEITPLGLACERGHLEIVKLLLRYGADPNNDMGPENLIQIATRSGHQHVADFLRTIIPALPAGGGVTRRKYRKYRKSKKTRAVVNRWSKINS